MVMRCPGIGLGSSLATTLSAQPERPFADQLRGVLALAGQLAPAGPGTG
jgi:hypothetical protein